MGTNALDFQEIKKRVRQSLYVLHFFWHCILYTYRYFKWPNFKSVTDEITQDTTVNGRSKCSVYYWIIAFELDKCYDKNREWKQTILFCRIQYRYFDRGLVVHVSLASYSVPLKLIVFCINPA